MWLSLHWTLSQGTYPRATILTFVTVVTSSVVTTQPDKMLSTKQERGAT